MTFTTRPTLQGTFGMVSSTHWLASQSAMRMLERGGNAFDAAVAAGFVLHVVEPHLNGPGGEVPAIFATAQDPTPDGAVRAGAGAGRRDHRALPLARASTWCPAPARSPPPSPAPSTPGCCCCATTARCSLRDVLDAGDRLRRAHGHPLLAAGRRDRRGACRSCSSEHWPTSAALWLRGRQAAARRGAVRQPGVRRHPRPARRRGRGGRRRTARRRSTPPGAPGARASSPRRSTRSQRRPFRDSSGEAHAGAGHRRRPGRLLARPGSEPATHRLARLHGREDRPVGPGPGAAAVAGAARRGCADPTVLDPSTVDGRRTRIAEVLKLAFADREAWYGDGSPVPARRRCSPRRTSRSALALVGDARLGASCGPGRPAGATPRLPGARAATGSRERPDAGGPDDGRADRVAGPARPGATPATSTSSTAGAT